MGDKISYGINRAEIRQDRMQMTVINRWPQFSHSVVVEERREIEKQLFHIFQKYA